MWIWEIAPDMRNKMTEMGTAKVKTFHNIQREI